MNQRKPERKAMWLILFCSLPCLPVSAQQENPRQIFERLESDLISQEVKRTKRAYNELLFLHRISREHFRIVGNKDFWQDVDAGDRQDRGTTAMALSLMGLLRVEEVVPTLVEHIDWSVDTSTYRVGARRNPDARLGVVQALIGISGPRVRRFVIKKLRTTTDEKQRLCCLWVLNQTEDKYLPIILDKEIEDFWDEAQKSNLLAAKALLPDLKEKFYHFASTGQIQATQSAPTP